ncbi:MAG TPA: hypothetical protein VIQ05_17020 [Tardiphaga sp.]
MIIIPYQRLFDDRRIAQLWVFLVALEQSRFIIFRMAATTQGGLYGRDNAERRPGGTALSMTLAASGPRQPG